MNKLKVQMTKTDWLLEITGLLGIIFIVVVILLSYNDLPDTIPWHFNVIGQPDGFGGKSLLLILLAVTISTHLLMTVGLRFLHLFRYPFQVTERNVELHYKNLALMVRTLKTITVMIFAYLVYATIQNGFGEMYGLGKWFIPLSSLFVLGIVGYFMYKEFRLR